MSSRPFFGVLAALVVTSLGSNHVIASSTPTLLHHFDPSVRIENLTILPNSTIIVCNAFNGTLYGINALEGSPGAEPYFITSFYPETDAIFGLSSPSPSTIAATANNFTWDTTSPTFGPSAGSNVVHLVTLPPHSPNHHQHYDESMKKEHVTIQSFPIPTASWLNGLTSVPPAPSEEQLETPRYLLLADCLAGSLIRLDLHTGEYLTVIEDDPLFKPTPGSELPIGINGIHMSPSPSSSSHDDNGGSDNHWLYFTNTDLGIYGRVALTSEGLSAGFPGQILVNGTGGSTFDDFGLLSSSPGGDNHEDVGFLATGLGEANGIEKVVVVDDGQVRTDMMASWEMGSEEYSQPVSVVVDPRSGGAKGAGGNLVLYFATAGEYLGSGVPATGAQVFSLEVGC